MCGRFTFGEKKSKSLAYINSMSLQLNKGNYFKNILPLARNGEIVTPKLKCTAITWKSMLFLTKGHTSHLQKNV